ncbi:hypothetical protein IPA_08095 [Ignicoccus pacificus DSM 13166]|uniref:Uncharacterized protein n=1 Tax=Ignicoccus pacificus DSM 13166 TaxID=940294 RepID=A0A977PLR9_9CREN|nr:hypothetical protein IPA_08095 [Ignicoccus pacificus DSM 13166]
MRILVLLALVAIAIASPLQQLWQYLTPSSYSINSVSVGNLTVVASSSPSSYSSGCFYILNKTDGKLLNTICPPGGASSTSYANGTFALLSYDGYVYLLNETTLNYSSVYIGTDYSYGIVLVPGGFVACYNGCAMFNYQGQAEWNVTGLNVLSNPAFNGTAIFVPDSISSSVVILDLNGKKIGTPIQLPEMPWSVAACGEYLAVKAVGGLYLYDLSSSPTLLWIRNDLGSYGQVVFLGNCSYLVVGASTKLSLLNVDGKLLYQVTYPLTIKSVGWNLGLAIGFGDGTLYFYYLNTTELKTITTLMTSNEAGAPITPIPMILPLAYFLYRKSDRLSRKR